MTGSSGRHFYTTSRYSTLIATMAQPSTAINPEQFPYTCIGCSLAFSDATFQREHYQVGNLLCHILTRSLRRDTTSYTGSADIEQQSDLHRYNSKRRVAGLGPVTAELFNDKIKERQGSANTEAQDAPQDNQRPNCKACK
jgi:pre-60S factor REI1